MKTQSKFLLLTILSISLLFVGCRNNPDNKQLTNNDLQKQEQKTTQKVDEFSKLVNYLETNGDFINSPYVPALIGADKVKENLDNPRFLVLDIRKPQDFEEAHIKSAENVKFYDLINYFENEISPQDYDKIVLVCYSGQTASYGAGILNLLGYDNVYAMKFGMSSWDLKNAKKAWLKNISDKYVDKLETRENTKRAPGQYPVVYTGEKEPKDILLKQAQKALDDPFKSRLISADEVFNNPDKYYIINYWPKEKYLAGHIPGAVQYTPKKTLSTKTYLNTLPVDKPIVVYCYTGQHASFVTSFLNILGYDARILKYGANSFMHKKLLEKKWHPFTKKAIHNYPVVKGELVQ
jgi:rhodanese-related sulfurtransferase